MTNSTKKFILSIWIVTAGLSVVCAAPHFQVQRGFSGSVYEAVISDDERILISSEADSHSVLVWDMRTEKLLHVYDGHKGTITGLALSNDRKWLASVSSDGILILRSYATGEITAQFDCGGSFVETQLQFSPDGNILYYANTKAGTAAYDIDLKRTVFTIHDSSSLKYQFSLSKDGSYLYKVSQNTQASRFNARTGQMDKTFITSGKEIKHLCSSSDSSQFVIIDAQNKVTVTDGDGKQKSTWTLNVGEQLNDPKISLNNQNLIISERYKVTLYSLSDGAKVKEITVPYGWNPIPIQQDSKIVYSTLNDVQIIDSKTSKVLSLIGNTASVGIRSSSISGDGMFFGASRSRGLPMLWNVRTGESMMTMLKPAAGAQDVSIIMNGSTAVTVGDHVMIWDLEKKQALPAVPNENDFSEALIHPSNQQLWLHAPRDKPGAGKFFKWSLNPLKKTGSYSDGNSFMAHNFSSDGAYLLTHDFESKGSSIEVAQIWDMKGKAPRKINSFRVESGVAGFGAASFTPDNKHILIGSTAVDVDIYDIAAGEQVKKLQGHEDIVFAAASSPDGKHIASASRDMSLKIWNAETGKLEKNYSAGRLIKSLTYFSDSRYLLSGSADGACIIWDTETGDYTVFLNSKDGAQWLVYNSDGMWDGSRDCGELVAMSENSSVWNIDQFALKNNRPDLVLQKLPNSDSAVIRYYFAQYQKRLKRMGFVDAQGNADESLLFKDYHVPEAVLTSLQQDKKEAVINFSLTDTQYTIKRYNIYINDVPLFGALGKDLGDSESKTLHLQERVELISGTNKIEISCMNEKGAESLRSLGIASYNEPAAGDYYVLAFGVSTYADSRLNLKYADKDARDLASLFNNMKPANGTVHTKIFTNQEVTTAAIKEAKAFVEKAKVDDTFVLFIAGHGIHDTDKEETYYFLTYETDINNLQGTAANFELIEDLLQGIAPRNKLFLMDTCESGESDAAVEKAVLAFADSRGITARTTRGLSVSAAGSTAAPRPYLAQKDRFIYNDLLRRSGAIVFSSCRGGEFSYESDAVGNGFFTKKIIEGLSGAAGSGKDNVAVDDLRNFVSTEVASLSGGLQNPTVDRDNLYQKFSLPLLK